MSNTWDTEIDRRLEDRTIAIDEDECQKVRAASLDLISQLDFAIQDLNRRRALIELGLLKLKPGIISLFTLERISRIKSQMLSRRVNPS